MEGPDVMDRLVTFLLAGVAKREISTNDENRKVK